MHAQQHALTNAQVEREGGRQESRKCSGRGFESPSAEPRSTERPSGCTRAATAAERREVPNVGECRVVRRTLEVFERQINHRARTGAVGAAEDVKHGGHVS